jgi:triosephosphate isomerase
VPATPAERRALCREDNELVGAKSEYALSQGLKVIACIGETLAERESGHMFDVMDAQLRWACGWVGGWAGVVVTIFLLDAVLAERSGMVQFLGLSLL